jgi:hypothetical protein
VGGAVGDTRSVGNRRTSRGSFATSAIVSARRTGRGDDGIRRPVVAQGLADVVFQGDADWPRHADRVDAYRDALSAWFTQGGGSGLESRFAGTTVNWQVREFIDTDDEITDQDYFEVRESYASGWLDADPSQGRRLDDHLLATSAIKFAEMERNGEEYKIGFTQSFKKRRTDAGEPAHIMESGFPRRGLFRQGGGARGVGVHVMVSGAQPDLTSLREMRIAPSAAGIRTQISVATRN